MYAHVHWLYCVAVLVLLVKTTSQDVLNNGPIGLPQNIKVNDAFEKRRRRRHRRLTDSKESNAQISQQLYTPATLEKIKNVEAHKPELDELVKDNRENGLAVQGPNLNINLLQIIPDWMRYLPTNYMSAKNFVFNAIRSLSSIGLSSLLSSSLFSNVLCKRTSTNEEKVICMSQTIDNATNLFNIGSEILSLNFRVLAGGNMALEALSTLNTLSAIPLSRLLMKTLGTTAALYITLMREGVSDETKQLAGSVMTEITSLPVISNVSDISSGGFGRANVIIPRPSRINRADYDVAKLRAGANEKQLLTSV